MSIKWSNLDRIINHSLTLQGNKSPVIKTNNKWLLCLDIFISLYHYLGILAIWKINRKCCIKLPCRRLCVWNLFGSFYSLGEYSSAPDNWPPLHYWNTVGNTNKQTYIFKGNKILEGGGWVITFMDALSCMHHYWFHWQLWCGSFAHPFLVLVSLVWWRFHCVQTWSWFTCRIQCNAILYTSW